MIKSIIISASLAINIAMAVDNPNNPKAIELLKMHPSLMEGPIQLDDLLPEKNRNLLDNKYFKISYPKCYKIETYADDGSGKTNLQTHSMIEFTKGPSCKEVQSDLKSFVVSFTRSMKKNPNAQESYKKNKFLLKKYSIDGKDASIVGYLDDNRGPTDGSFKPQTVILWNFQIYCPNSKYNFIEARGEALRGSSVSEYFKKGDFKVPENFEQVLSTLRCK